jgi:hypothetical protein
MIPNLSFPKRVMLEDVKDIILFSQASYDAQDILHFCHTSQELTLNPLVLNAVQSTLGNEQLAVSNLLHKYKEVVVQNTMCKVLFRYLNEAGVAIFNDKCVASIVIN